MNMLDSDFLDADIAAAVRKKDFRSIISIFFATDTKVPTLRDGYKHESNLWEFKSDCPFVERGNDNAWAEISKDILALYNARGGIIFFGINDKSYNFVGATPKLDNNAFNSKKRKYLGDQFWVDFTRAFIQENERYLGIAIVPPRGPVIGRFLEDAPIVNGKRQFATGDSAIRENESAVIVRATDVSSRFKQYSMSAARGKYLIDERYYRLFSPDYNEFVDRAIPCKAILESIRNPRIATTAIHGMGGIGKTALATWAINELYNLHEHEYIVSITAKDRELTESGISPLNPDLSNLQSLYDCILDVLDFRELKPLGMEEKTREVRQLMTDMRGLILIDNLETVTDPLIIEFLNSLPPNAKAITTSRRVKVKVSCFPYDPGPLTEQELINFIKTLSKVPGYHYIESISDKDKALIGNGCGGVPIIIKWVLFRSETSSEAIHLADELKRYGRENEELLEFCFRRVFESMTDSERTIMYAMAAMGDVQNGGALQAATGLSNIGIDDTLEELSSDSIIQRRFDSDHNEYIYTLLPITKLYVDQNPNRSRGLDSRIRSRLKDFYEATDIKDPRKRSILSNIRKGLHSDVNLMIDSARVELRRKNDGEAIALLEQALKQDPTSWRAPKLLAEVYRQQDNIGKSVEYYEIALANAPRTGYERTTIYRESAIMIKKSGSSDCVDRATSLLEVAHDENPHDPLTLILLTDAYGSRNNYLQLIRILEKGMPILVEDVRKREEAARWLYKAYKATGEIVKAGEVKAKYGLDRVN